MKIVESFYAREVRDEFRVQLNPIRKRRRNYHVVKVHIDRPGAYVTADGVCYMHPDLIAKLRGEVKKGE